jgi:hypothetical protein
MRKNNCSGLSGPVVEKTLKAEFEIKVKRSVHSSREESGLLFFATPKSAAKKRGVQ